MKYFPVFRGVFRNFGDYLITSAHFALKNVKTKHLGLCFHWCWLKLAQCVDLFPHISKELLHSRMASQAEGMTAIVKVHTMELRNTPIFVQRGLTLFVALMHHNTVSHVTASVLHGRSREEGPHNRKTTGNGAHNNNIHKTKPGDCSPVPKYQRGNKIKSSLFLAVQWPYVLACRWINITLYGFYCC